MKQEKNDRPKNGLKNNGGFPSSGWAGGFKFVADAQLF